MFSFYSLGKIHLWYSAIDFCVVSQSINLFFCVKIQISVVPLSIEYFFFEERSLILEGDKYKMYIIFILPTFTTRAGRDFFSSFSTSFVN